MLLAITGDTGAVLVHAHDRSIDQLHRRVMSAGEDIHDMIPDASAAPPNEVIAAGSVGTEALLQIAPRRT
jgi:hypothetical protein